MLKSEILVAQPKAAAMVNAAPAPNKIPIMPPLKVIATASIKNCADRFTQSYFARTFRDRYQHDIHNADSTH